jgi:drug/metabolite transporter (DMT)-like permease
MSCAFSGGPENGRIVSVRAYVPPPSIITLVVLLALGWGFSWPVMKVVMAEMPPLHFRVLCLAAGAAGLFAIARANRLPIRVPPGAWPRLIAITLFNVAAWNVLAVYGVTFMESGRAAIFAYTFPVWGVLRGAHQPGRCCSSLRRSAGRSASRS